jgi:hypothetical protein
MDDELNRDAHRLAQAFSALAATHTTLSEVVLEAALRVVAAVATSTGCEAAARDRLEELLDVLREADVVH